MLRSLVAICICFLIPIALVAESVTVPFGTTVYCELDERVTSKKKETSKGDVVRAHVWKDVWMGNHLVIKAGTPVFVRVGDVKKAKIAGRKGKLELEALNVTAVDGRDVSLDGGYDQSGRGRMGLSIALAAVVAWPLIFLKGKQAVLEPGTIFDAMVRSPIDVNVESSSAPRLVIQPSLEVEVMYEDLDPDEKLRELPLKITSETSTTEGATVDSVNGSTIEPIEVRIVGHEEGHALGLIDFKALSRHFVKGMNRFEVVVGDERADVLLEIEL